MLGNTSAPSLVASQSEICCKLTKLGAIGHALLSGTLPDARPPVGRSSLRSGARSALQAAILAALRKRNGGIVVSEGALARWRLAQNANTFGSNHCFNNRKAT